MIRTLLELSKVRISVLATISTAVGYILATGKFSWNILIPITGIFLLACSSCAFNQIQDLNLDRQMIRTKGRPIPAGKLSPKVAFIYATTMLLLGSVILYFGANLLTLGLGLFAVVWYNGVYTYLKRVSSLAVIPGSLIGSIPPMVGWASTGRDILEPPILCLAFLFFIWQIPHFWLLILNYSNDYENAGIPTLRRIFSIHQLERITFIWIVATAVTGIILPVHTGMLSPINLLFMIASLWIIWVSVSLLKSNVTQVYIMRTFKDINIYILLIIMILTVGKLFNFDHSDVTLLVQR